MGFVILGHTYTITYFVFYIHNHDINSVTPKHYSYLEDRDHSGRSPLCSGTAPWESLSSRHYLSSIRLNPDSCSHCLANLEENVIIIKRADKNSVIKVGT